MLRVFLLLAAALPAAASLVTVSFTARITRADLYQFYEPIPSDTFGPLPSVGQQMSGSFVYDLAVNTDGLSDPEYGFYGGAPVSASVTAGPLSTSFAASSTTPSNSSTLIMNNINPGGVIHDGFDNTAGRNSGGWLLNGHAALITNWRTTNLAMLNSDAMQVLPEGITFDLYRNVSYREVNNPYILEIYADLESYSVTAVPEPATAVPMLLGAAAVIRAAARKRTKQYT